MIRLRRLTPTFCAFHLGFSLARSDPGSRLLLTTFSDTLANQLRAKLTVLMSDESGAAGMVDVQSLDAVGLSLYEARFGTAELATWETVEELVQKAASVEGTKFALTFVASEWERVIDAWQLSTWEDYRDVRRIGRYRRLSEAQRETLWPVFERVRAGLRERALITKADMFGRLTTELAGQEFSPYQYVVVDEAQDVSVPQLRFLAALVGGRQNGLFFAGDLGQRIFQQPFSWRELGVDVRGRSQSLRINYRTSHQIRTQADRLLDPELSDVDGSTEERKGTVSVFNGPHPMVKALDNEEAEAEALSEWLEARIKNGLEPDEIAVFVRSSEQIDRAVAAANRAGAPCAVLDGGMGAIDGAITVGTMHLAKGLEFRAVAVMACDSEVIPLQSRVESIVDEADLEEVYNTERNLLYVACTRVRDHLLVTGVKPVSEFLDDLVINDN